MDGISSSIVKIRTSGSVDGVDEESREKAMLGSCQDRFDKMGKLSWVVVVVMWVVVVVAVWVMVVVVRVVVVVVWMVVVMG